MRLGWFGAAKAPRKFKLASLGGLLLLAAAAWLGAQALAPSKPAADLIPAGALFYLEARNFGQLVAHWDASPEKKAWLASANYQSFQRSHLLTRLAETRKRFTDAAGLPEDAALLPGVAGGESAVAFYDIGKLEFLYVTQIGSARFGESALGKVKQKFQARKAAGRDYFVLSRGDNTIAFALVDDRLMLATREDLVAGALQLLAGQNVAALRQESWFIEALAKAAGGSTPPDVRFVADLQKTSRTPQFRSYWIQHNVSEVRQFASEVADLRFGAADVREDRVFIRRDAQDSLASAEPAVADVLRYASADAGFYQAIAKPTADDVAEMLARKVFGHGRALERQYQRRTVPDAPGAAVVAGEDDYETRVDSAQVSEDMVDAYAPLRALAANADAVLQTGASNPARALPSLEAVVVLHGISAWKAADVKRVLGEVAGAVWPGSGEWTDASGYSELGSITPLRFAIDGNILLLSASPEWMSRVLSVRRAGASGGATYVASVRFAQELPGFARMTKLIDFPSIPQAGDAVREPLFFSENLASLAGAMSRLDSATVTAHDTGAMVTESIVYRKK